jgi:hypothetical protein
VDERVEDLIPAVIAKLVIWRRREGPQLTNGVSGEARTWPFPAFPDNWVDERVKDIIPTVIAKLVFWYHRQIRTDTSRAIITSMVISQVFALEPPERAKLGREEYKVGGLHVQSLGRGVTRKRYKIV